MKSVGSPPCGCSAWKPGSSPRSRVMPDRGSESKITTVLALDFGLRRIGIASGDTLMRTARPRGAIGNGPSGPDWDALRRFLDDVRPARIAVGEPYNADGSASPLTETAR